MYVAIRIRRTGAIPPVPTLNNDVNRDQFDWPNFSFTWTYFNAQTTKQSEASRLIVPTRFQNTNQNAKLRLMLNLRFALSKCAIKNTQSPYEEVCAAQL